MDNEICWAKGGPQADTQCAERNGRKTLTTVQGLPKKFDQKKILKVIKKKFGMSEESASKRIKPWERWLMRDSLQWHNRHRQRDG